MTRRVLALRHRRRAKRYLLLAICGLVLTGLLVHEITGENGYLVRRERRRQIQALEEEIGKLQQDNLRLTDRIQALRSDPQAIEELARERLRMARPGEFIVTLPPADPPSQPLPDSSSEP